MNYHRLELWWDTWEEKWEVKYGIARSFRCVPSTHIVRFFRIRTV